MTHDRSGPVLDAALAVFCQYGYAKTTMSDVARAAGISRAALYLHFSTKEELFRAGSRRAHAQALAAADAALATPRHVITRVDRAMSAYITELTAPTAASPHSGELLDAGLSVTADIVAESNHALLDRLATALDTAAAAGEIQLDVPGIELAQVLVAAAEGLKRAIPDARTWRDRRALFFRLVEAALR
ncbi:TetR/AcrR family transcriptional regulator [Kutzneria buriramensis]|uniref:AcrR family transcriptional regulator n=1 Tax=Kutzneria buriramensis TaxID=1045776 RepID=A0A3E0HE41_9PSEU|nr:TetR/AcrR family transcriptional regulator [Kutzneria buriramensis]REH43502.1 AcrR family transcriptional regulator [Kutzneria buriramensis]